MQWAEGPASMMHDPKISGIAGMFARNFHVEAESPALMLNLKALGAVAKGTYRASK